MKLSAQATLGQPEEFIQAKEGLFEASGSIGIDSKPFVQSWMDRHVVWVREHVA
jgi:chromate reductase